MKAFEESMRIDRRRLRIQPLLHEILNIVSKHLSEEDRRNDALREIHYELFDKLHEQGVEIVLDSTRAEIGLPPRGPDGWTNEELIAVEQKRLEMITQPLQMIVPLKQFIGP